MFKVVATNPKNQSNPHVSTTALRPTHAEAVQEMVRQLSDYRSVEIVRVSNLGFRQTLVR